MNKPPIVVSIREGLGNQLFQLAFGLIMAKELGRELFCIGGMELIQNIQGYRPVPKGLELKDFELFTFHKIDPRRLAQAVAQERMICLEGWFQRYDYYAQYKPWIVSLFSKSLFQDCPGGQESELVIHVRTSDYRSPAMQARYMLPIGVDYYQACVDAGDWDRVVIVTDDADDECLSDLRKRFAAELVSESSLHDFNYLRNSKNLVLSPSTFSWWAAWLSEARRIFFPLKSVWNPLLRPEINLMVAEERYNYTLGNDIKKDFALAPRSGVMPKSEQMKKYLAGMHQIDQNFWSSVDHELKSLM